MPYKICNKVNCNKLIDSRYTYCEAHREDEEAKRIKYIKRYDEARKCGKEFVFYRSKEWINIREVIKSKYKGICIYTYYTQNKIVKADEVHHIIEIKDDFNKRLDLDNLIPVSRSAHKQIHRLYSNSEHSKQSTIKKLKGFIARFNKEFNL